MMMMISYRAKSVKRWIDAVEPVGWVAKVGLAGKWPERERERERDAAADILNAKGIITP